MPCRLDMPQSLWIVCLKLGEVAYWSASIGQNGSLLPLVWKDKKDFCMSSTMDKVELRPEAKTE